MKIKYFVLFLTIILFLYSCSDKKKSNTDTEEITEATELEDLLIKYKELEVKNCEELFAVGNEMIDVYIKTINRAYEGNERAKSDLLDFDIFTNKFDIEAAKISADCPEEFKSWAESIEKKMEKEKEKLMEILNNDFHEYIEIDNEILDDLDRQLKELYEDIEKLNNEGKISEEEIKDTEIII
ncbi:MAG: hypothetical protein LBQ22_09690 [Bacteroidales bacterium]|jgi:hypothetical protein|nr:hypothetical protein [Bacteroidales bacterium]